MVIIDFLSYLIRNVASFFLSFASILLVIIYCSNTFNFYILLAPTVESACLLSIDFNFFFNYRYFVFRIFLFLHLYLPNLIFLRFIYFNIVIEKNIILILILSQIYNLFLHIDHTLTLIKLRILKVRMIKIHINDWIIVINYTYCSPGRLLIWVGSIWSRNSLLSVAAHVLSSPIERVVSKFVNHRWYTCLSRLLHLSL